MADVAEPLTEHEKMLAKRRQAKLGRETEKRQQSKRFNVALFRLVEGKGGIIKNLCDVTGMTEDQIKGRVKRVRYDYKPSDIDPHADELDGADRRYLTKMYAKSKNPAIRAFLGSINAPVRSKPDCRSSADPRPKIVTRRAG